MTWRKKDPQEEWFKKKEVIVKKNKEGKKARNSVWF